VSKIFIIGYVPHRIHPVSHSRIGVAGYGVVVQKWIRKVDENKFTRRLKRLHKEKHIEINFIKKEKPRKR